MTRERLIYFAGSIRGGRDDWAQYFELIGELGRYGTVLTEHVGDGDLSLSGEDLDDRQIHDRDIEWLASADCLVAEVTTPSLGVGYEIGKASEWGKPILCIYRPQNTQLLSAMIAGSPGITLQSYGSTSEATKIFEIFFQE